MEVLTMLELWFSSREEAEKAENGLSKFGEIERMKKVDPSANERTLLSKSYDEAIEYLDEKIEEEEDEDSVPANFKKALETTKNLLESGKHDWILAADDREEAEERLYDTAEELEYIRKMKERVNRNLEEKRDSSAEKEEKESETEEETEEEEEEQKVTREEMKKLFSLRRFLVNPILTILRNLEREEDPLDTFLDDVSLDVSIARGQFEDLESEVEVNTTLIHGLKMGIDHVLHASDVLEKIQQFRIINNPKESIYGLINLQIITNEVLSEVRGKKKAMYNEFLEDLRKSINGTTQELEDGKLRSMTDEDTLDYIVRKLKRAGYVRKKGNKISDARA
uniref:Uncharacterized protein n=1 Tax=uncultured organism TaxID=155900 RepID=M1PQG3_9ZZZZ|nr:hypothetical protein FLSS-25_0006 [uncultured organism]